MKRIIAILALFSASLALQACGCDDGSPWTHWDGMTDMGDTRWDTTSDGTYDPFAEPTIPPGTGSIQGIVYSPEPPMGAVTSKFPISGALVYVTDVAPSPIDPGVYCHECVEMPETQPHDITGPDGSFFIGNMRAGTYLLVVQKGEFRRVRYIDVVDDVTTTIDGETTTFPNRHYPDAQDSTPSIAVALGSFDDMQDILAKIGLCELNPDGSAILDTCDHIDFYDNEGGFGSPYPPFRDLLNSRLLMNQYHIIFVPCSNSTTDAALSDVTVRENVRGWVDDGGKWYVADWSYDFVEQFFPDFLDFEGNDTTIGDADDISLDWMDFDSLGRAVDEDLRAWLLHSMGLSPDSIDFVENWDVICELGTVEGTDPGDGSTIWVTPDVYCDGPITSGRGGMDCSAGDKPLTLTFPYGCGKVLFTTYHTVGEMSGPHPELLPQEVILVYMILEIGLCTDPVIII